MCQKQKQKILILLILFILLAEVTVAQRADGARQGGWRRDDEVGRLYDPARTTTLEGKVVGLEKSVSVERQSHGVHLLLDTGEEVIPVHLGPLWFIENLETKLTEGDRVKVEGSRIELNGKSAVIAAKVVAGQRTIELRDSMGVPMWKGWRRESQNGLLQCPLQGVVTDSSGAAIPGAVVAIEPSNRSVVTERDGSYCFTQIDSKAEVLSVVAEGFEKERIEIEVAAGGPTLINVVLFPAILEETVTVTAATRTVKRLEEVPVRTEIVLPEMIELSASRNLADAVEFTPGIRVESSCQNCNFSQIRMLGLQGAYTQILFDGQPTMSSLAQVYGVEQIPARMIERLEVVKGGGSAVYGPGSVGGVINVISHTPDHTSGFLLGRMGWMNGTPNQTLSASGEWASGDRNRSVLAFGQADRVNPLDIDGDGFTEVAKRQFGAAGARFHQNLLDQKGKLCFDFNHIREDRRGGDLMHLPPHQANIAEAINSRRNAGGVSWQHTPNTSFDYRLALSLAHTDRDTYYGSGMDPNAYGESRNMLWVLDSQFNHFLSSHILSWGGQVSTDSIEDVQPAYHRFYNNSYRNVGFFLQDDWFFLPGFELVYGARVDKHSEVKHAIFSPRVALMWSARPTLNVRASIATGFLPPQVFDEDLHISQVGGEGHVHRNADDLKEERSTTITGGLEWKPSWGKGVGLVEFNLFHTGIRDLFHIVEDDDPETDQTEFTRINFGEAKVYGAEINVGYAITTELELQAGFVEQRSRFSEEEPDFGSKDFFRTPNRYGLATVIYRNPRLLDLFFGARYTGEMKVPHYAGYIPEDRLATTPGHWTFDASISRAFPFRSDSKVTVTLGGKNLTNYFQDDFDRGPYRDSGYVWGPRFPRTLYVSTALEF
jgi:outer membrane receptor for ferrienterochelin and colicins